MLERLTHHLQSNKKILFVGVGNVLKHDDGVGVNITERIHPTERIRALTVGQSIENNIGKIQQMKPDLLIIVDGVDFNKNPGEAFLLPLEELKDYTTNTHNISFKTISQFFDMPVEILGIQPERVEYGEGLSEAVQKVVAEMWEVIQAYQAKDEHRE